MSIHKINSLEVAKLHYLHLNNLRRIIEPMRTAKNDPGTEPQKTDTAAAIPQANLAPGVGGAMMLMSRPGMLTFFQQGYDQSRY